MARFFRTLKSVLVAAVCAALISACATNGEAKAPDPGSKKWYTQRMQEIEASKAEGKLTDEQYLSLKNEADATRAAYQNSRNTGNYYNTPHSGSGVGVGIGIGAFHSH